MRCVSLEQRARSQRRRRSDERASRVHVQPVARHASRSARIVRVRCGRTRRRLAFTLRPRLTSEIILDADARSRRWPAGLGLRLRPAAESRRQRGAARRPARRPPAPFLAPYSGPRLIPTPLDVRDREAVLALMRECDAVMSAIPYYFNLRLAELAVEAGVHFCDLGGNTEIVFQQKALDDAGEGEGRHRRSRLRPRAGHGEHPRRVRHPPARHGRVGEDLRRRAAAAARAAAQLPDRVLARGRARLLHDALVGRCATASARR